MFAKSNTKLIQDLLHTVRQDLEFYAETQMPDSATESVRRRLLTERLQLIAIDLLTFP